MNSKPVIAAQIDGKTLAMTDEGAVAISLGREFERHEVSQSQQREKLGVIDAERMAKSIRAWSGRTG